MKLPFSTLAAKPIQRRLSTLITSFNLTFFQLLSRSVAVGLKFYREQGKPGFEDTESFTRMMNDLFDALNAKCPAKGIRKNSSQMKA